MKTFVAVILGLLSCFADAGNKLSLTSAMPCNCFNNNHFEMSSLHNVIGNKSTDELKVTLKPVSRHSKPVEIFFTVFLHKKLLLEYVNKYLSNLQTSNTSKMYESLEMSQLITFVDPSVGLICSQPKTTLNVCKT